MSASACVCMYVFVCECACVCVVRIRREGEAVHLAARRGRMESWRTAAGGYGVKTQGGRVLGWSKVDEERVVKWGCLGGRTRGGSGR